MKTALMRRNNAEKGQSLVEMTVGMVILVMLLSGLLDLGRIFYIYVALEDAAGEAALYLSIDPYCQDDNDWRDPTPANINGDECRCANPNNAKYRAERAPGADVIDWSLITYTPTVPLRNVDGELEPIVTPGGQVSVELSYPVSLLSPFIPSFTGVNPIMLRSTATQTIIRYWKSEPDMACATS
jgi:Flp pilus assembly protein TadG